MREVYELYGVPVCLRDFGHHYLPTLVAATFTVVRLMAVDGQPVISVVENMVETDRNEIIAGVVQKKNEVRIFNAAFKRDKLELNDYFKEQVLLARLSQTKNILLGTCVYR